MLRQAAHPTVYRRIALDQPAAGVINATRRPRFT
jgi:hypothetical protein